MAPLPLLPLEIRLTFPPYIKFPDYRAFQPNMEKAFFPFALSVTGLLSLALRKKAYCLLVVRRAQYPFNFVFAFSSLIESVEYSPLGKELSFVLTTLALELPLPRGYSE